MSERRLALMLALLVILLDQLSKYWITQHFIPGEEWPVTSFFSLLYARNTGAAFSLFADQAGWQRGLFSAIAIGVSLVILYLLQRPGRLMAKLGLALVLGGALGNLIDRVTLGYVVDFLWFHIHEHAWPAFNVADSAIDAGAALLIWDSLRKRPSDVSPLQDSQP